MQPLVVFAEGVDASRYGLCLCLQDDQVKVLKRGGCWLCIPYVISDVTLTTFWYAVTRKKNRADSAKSLLREAGSIAIEDAMGFAKDYQVRFVPIVCFLLKAQSLAAPLSGRIVCTMQMSEFAAYPGLLDGCS
jgi:hypothetical protein